MRAASTRSNTPCASFSGDDPAGSFASFSFFLSGPLFGPGLSWRGAASDFTAMADGCTVGLTEVGAVWALLVGAGGEAAVAVAGFSTPFPVAEGSARGTQPTPAK